MEYNDVKRRGKDHRRGKQKYSGQGRGGAGNSGGAAGDGFGSPIGKGKCRGKGKKVARFGGRKALRGRGFSGQRRGRAAAHSGDNSYRFDEDIGDQYDYEMRLDRGADIEQLLSEQTGSGYGEAIKGPTVTKQAEGELNCHALALAMAGLPAAERLKLDTSLFEQQHEEVEVVIVGGATALGLPDPQLATAGSQTDATTGATPPVLALDVPSPVAICVPSGKAHAPRLQRPKASVDDELDNFLDSL